LTIITGNVEANLAAIEPGPPCVYHREKLWSRICRVYFATTIPSPELKKIINMIIMFSIPMLFTCNPGVNKVHWKHSDPYRC
jgi:hypothetical protein